MHSLLRISLAVAAFALSLVGCGGDQASINAADVSGSAENELRSSCIRDAFAQAGTPFDADVFRQKIEACIASRRDGGIGGGGFGGRRDAGFPGIPPIPSIPSFDAGVPTGGMTSSCEITTAPDGSCTAKKCVDGSCSEQTFAAGERCVCSTP